MRAKSKYVPAWMTQEQYAKLAALKVLRRTKSINAVICEIVDNVSVQIVVMQSEEQKTVPLTDKA